MITLCQEFGDKSQTESFGIESWQVIITKPGGPLRARQCSRDVLSLRA
jgi:hypothetical protein